MRPAAAASDGIIHLAFKHDIAFSGDFQGAADADRSAVEAFGEALAGSDRPFVIASGTLGLAPGHLATERDGQSPDPAMFAAGGPAARLAQDCIRKVEVLEYEELGMEAVWRIEVEDFPAFIVIDDKGNDFYDGME